MNNPIHILNYWPNNLPEKYLKLIKWEDRGDLVIFNYTDECNFSGAWDHVTKQTRGLIVNRHTMKAVAYPFDKFGNINQFPETMVQNLPKDIGFEVTEKLDGALGVLYRSLDDGLLSIATRGSFKSEEAIWATNFLRQMRPEKADPKIFFNIDRYTYIFEIMAEGTSFNHVAMKEPGLYLIGMRDMYSWKELMPSQVRKHAIALGIPYPASFDKSIDQLLEEAKTIEATECEGWVLHYESGLKVKVKGLAYMRLARFLQSFSPAHVFEMVMNGETMPEDLPADLYTECAVLTAKYRNEFTRRLNVIEEEFKKFEGITDKKQFAMNISMLNPPQWVRFALFAKRDKKFKPMDVWNGMYKEEVWKTL